jgi:hypothetical protein
MKRLALACLAALSAAGSCGETPRPKVSGATGAFGIVTVDGRQKLYLPQVDQNAQGDGFVSVIDVGAKGNGVAGAPALSAEIDLGTAEYATTTAGTSDIVVAASTDFPTVWLIDPRAERTVATIALPAGAGQSDFSGGGGYVTGIAMDPDNDRAILSVWNGFALLDLKSRTITRTIQAPPSENFGFDPVSQRIVAPFYDCATSHDANGSPPAVCESAKAPSGNTMTDGLSVIDLGSGTVYTYQDPTAVNPEQPVGGEPDSAAIDVSSGIAVVPSEEDGFYTLIDLRGATYDAAKKTVVAPRKRVLPYLGRDMTGISVEPSSHLAFLEQEFANRVAVANVGQALTGGGGYREALVPTPPGQFSWFNIGDPHGIAVTTSILDGRPCGFLVDASRSWIARVSLEDFASAKATDGNVDSADFARLVTFLDTTARP